MALIGIMTVLGYDTSGQDARQPGSPVSKEQIRNWINQLGDDDFEKREEASQKLWQLGEAAEAAIKEVLTSKDAEVSRRARELHDKFRLGIYPSTPQALVGLIERFQQNGPGNDGRLNRELLVQQFMEFGLSGCRTLLKLHQSEEKKENRDELSRLIADNLPGILPLVNTPADRELFEKIIDMGVRTGNKSGIRNAAAYWHQMHRLEDKIRYYQAEENNPRNSRENAEILAYLFRAVGNSAAAVDAARRAQLPALVTSLLIEGRYWKELCQHTDMAKKGNTDPVVLDDSRYRLATEAAFERLAGNKDRFEKAIQELTDLVKGENPEDRNRLVIAQLLMVLGKPKKSMEILKPELEDADTLFELLVAQHRIQEARELAKQVKANSKPDQLTLLLKLQSLEARVLYSLGEKDQAKKLFQTVAQQIKEEEHLDQLQNLIEPEFRAGLVDEAFEHAAILLSKPVPGASGYRPFLFNILFGSKAGSAERIWRTMRKISPEPSESLGIQKLRTFMGGKASEEELDRWEQKLSEMTKNLKVGEIKDFEPIWLGLGQAALMNRREDLARKCLQRSGTAEALLMLADLESAKNDWESAAKTYHQAWQKDRTQALPLYLSGRALIKSGKSPGGKERQEQAMAVPLGDEQLRAGFLDELARREDLDGLKQGLDLQFRFCQPNSYYFGDSLRRLSQMPTVQSEPGRQADYLERSLLRLLNSGVSFRIPAAYLVIPANVVSLRAQTHLAEGNKEELLADLALHQEYLPGNVDLVITMDPLLKKAGFNREADELYERSLSIHQGILKDYPKSAWAHNSIAWMSVCCRRNLPVAQEHAEKAVELSRTAGHLDTLAEVFFQRGNRDRAIEIQKQAISLAPERAYYKKQLQRIEAGDPRVPLPLEGDLED